MTIDDIRTVAVIGAGVMGQQIAMNTAIKGREAGFRVLLCDSFAAAAEKAAEPALRDYAELTVAAADIRIALRAARVQ